MLDRVCLQLEGCGLEGIEKRERTLSCIVVGWPEGEVGRKGSERVYKEERLQFVCKGHLRTGWGDFFCAHADLLKLWNGRTGEAISTRAIARPYKHALENDTWRFIRGALFVDDETWRTPKRGGTNYRAPSKV